MYSVDKNRRYPLRQIDAERDVQVRSSDQAESDRIIDDPVQVLAGASGVPFLDEIAQPADDLARAACLRGRLFDQLGRLPQLRRLLRVRGFQGALRRLCIIHNCGKRLIQLMRQRRRHLPHRAQARDMQKFRLKLLQAHLDAQPLRNVVENTHIDDPPVDAPFADRQKYGQDGAVLAAGDNFPADTDNMPLAGPPVMLKIAVMRLPIGRRHQHRHIAPDHLIGAITQKTFAGRVINLHHAIGIYHDYAVVSSRKQRFETRSIFPFIIGNIESACHF